MIFHPTVTIHIVGSPHQPERLPPRRLFKLLARLSLGATYHMEDSSLSQMNFYSQFNHIQ